MKRFLTLFIMPALAIYLCGCEVLVLGGAGAVVGAGGYRYYEGELKGELNARLMDAWEASKRAIEQMGYVIEEAKHKETEGKLKASKLKEDPVTIRLKYITYDRTEIGVRVGFLGDKDRSSAIIEKIQQNLRSR